MQTIANLIGYEKNGWRFEVMPFSAPGKGWRVVPTTFDKDSTGRPTFERAQDALDVAAYLDLSGY